MVRHLLDIDDLTPVEVRRVLTLAADPSPPRVLDGKGVVLIFEKPSSRTRSSTEIAVFQLGGHPVYVEGHEVGFDARETAEDIARTFACYHAVVGARVFSHSILERMAAVCSVPVVNLLSDRAHPLQALADVLTLQAELGADSDGGTGASGGSGGGGDRSSNQPPTTGSNGASGGSGGGGGDRGGSGSGGGVFGGGGGVSGGDGVFSGGGGVSGGGGGDNGDSGAGVSGSLEGRVLAYVGDSNNVARSLVLAAGVVGVSVNVASPPGYGFGTDSLARIRDYGCDITVLEDPVEAVSGAHAVYTDVWTSMGQEDEDAQRNAAFAAYTVDENLMSHAAPGAVFMHCLPAHRGYEVTDGVIDGPAGRVWPQATNRLHATRGLLLWLCEQKQLS